MLPCVIQLVIDLTGSQSIVHFSFELLVLHTWDCIPPLTLSLLATIVTVFVLYCFVINWMICSGLWSRVCIMLVIVSFLRSSVLSSWSERSVMMLLLSDKCVYLCVVRSCVTLDQELFIRYCIIAGRKHRHLRAVPFHFCDPSTHSLHVWLKFIKFGFVETNFVKLDIRRVYMENVFRKFSFLIIMSAMTRVQKNCILLPFHVPK